MDHSKWEIGLAVINNLNSRFFFELKFELFGRNQFIDRHVPSASPFDKKVLRGLPNLSGRTAPTCRWNRQVAHGSLNWGHCPHLTGQHKSPTLSLKNPSLLLHLQRACCIFPSLSVYKFLRALKRTWLFFSGLFRDRLPLSIGNRVPYNPLSHSRPFHQFFL